MSAPRSFTVILEPERDGGYSVHCPALPGCVSQGDSRQEALDNILEAIRTVLEVRDTDQFVSSMVADVLDGAPQSGKDDPEVIAQEIKHILKDRLEDGLPLTIEIVEVRLPQGVVA